MKQLRVIVQVRNNLLQQRREELRMTGSAISKAIGISAATYSGLETMSYLPFYEGGSRDGEWIPSVIALAKFHGIPPEELFPPEVLVMRGGKREMTCDVTDFAQLASHGPEELLMLREKIGSVRPLLSSSLNKTEAKVITQRFGLDDKSEMTFEEIGAKRNLSRERIRQIEIGALRKMRGVK
jgi:transcriptional regulator with XRE-family HTH domain